MKKRLLLPIIIFQFFLIPFIVVGQSANKTFHSTSDPHIFKNDQGATIEYLGMKNWTAKGIQDSLKSLAPNRPVHACMVLLKKYLGFADSMVLSHMSRDRKTSYTVVTVVEDSTKLNLLPTPKNKKSTIKKWTGELNLENRKNQNLLLRGISFLSIKDGNLTFNTKKVKKAPYISEEDSKFLIQFYNHIKNQNVQKDQILARKTIHNDGNIMNRILASIVLLNFDSSKSEKYLMLEQMRSENQKVSISAGAILRVMTHDSSTVDWSGATESIRALLAGTELYNLGRTLKILTKTKISSSLANEILTNNTFLLKERLKAKQKDTRKLTLAFTNQVSGEELTNSAEALEWLSQF